MSGGITVHDPEVQRWIFLPRRFANAQPGANERLRDTAYAFAEETAYEAGGALRVAVRRGPIDPSERIGRRYVDGMAWRGDPLRSWSFLVLQDYYGVMTAVGLEGEDSHENLEGHLAKAPPMPVVSHGNAFEARLWGVEVDWEGTDLALFPKELEDASLLPPNHHRWLPTTFGAVAVPEVKGEPWLFALWRGDSTRAADRDAFVREIWPLIAMRQGKCELFAGQLHQGLAETRREYGVPSHELAQRDKGAFTLVQVRNQQEEVARRLGDFERKVAFLERDLLTLKRNVEGLRILVDEMPMFAPQRALWHEELSSGFLNEQDAVESELAFLSLTRQELATRERQLATTASLAGERWNGIVAVVGALIAAAGLGQLIPDAMPWEPSGMTWTAFKFRFGFAFAALVVVLLAARYRKKG